MSGMDEVSRSIGKLQGKVEGIEKSQVAIFEKLNLIHACQTGQKVSMAKLSSKVGFITAIVTYGFLEGARLYFSSHNGQ